MQAVRRKNRQVQLVFILGSSETSTLAFRLLLDLNYKTKQLNKALAAHCCFLLKLNHKVFHCFLLVVADAPLPPNSLPAMPLSPFDPLDQNRLTELMLEATQNALNDVIRIGEFLVGGGDTSTLGGHPDIRY